MCQMVKLPYVLEVLAVLTVVYFPGDAHHRLSPGQIE